MTDLTRILHGSAHRLDLPDESVHMIATSPPFYGLRSYQGEQGVDWPEVSYAPMAGLAELTIPAMTCDLGAESTPEAYIGHLILCLREWWRVLRTDGTCWVNLGSSYASGGKSPSPSLPVRREPACGNGDKEQSDLQDSDHVYSRSDDEHQDDFPNRRHRNVRNIPLPPATVSLPLPTARDSGIQASVSTSPDVLPPSVQGSTTPSSSANDQDASSLSSEASVFPSEYRTSSDDGSQFARRADYSHGKSEIEPTSDGRNSGRQSFSVAYQSPLESDGSTRDIITQNPHKSYYKPKDLVMIPAMFALAAQADGWWVRSEIPWVKRNCLSGGTLVYARTQKGEMPMAIKDMVRLDPATIQLWNGENWTQVIDWWQEKDPENPLEIELRNGLRIGCTAEHRWPTENGILHARDLRVGDVIQSCRLPEPNVPTPDHIPDEVGWLVGIYLAEGSRSRKTIQIASHAKETERFERLTAIATWFGATCRMHLKDGNSATINLHSKVLNGIIDTYIGGKDAKGKHLAPPCWRRSNRFLEYLLEGYLQGDGSYEEKNNRWRLGFAKNYTLRDNLLTLCARIGVHCRIHHASGNYNQKAYPMFRGEIRYERKPVRFGTRFASKSDTEIVSIRRSNARQFYDIAVKDEPHLFSLACGVLTHNCMPGSQKDRPTTSHEHIYLLTKSPTYFWDQEAVKVQSDDPKGSAARYKSEFFNAEKHTSGGYSADGAKHTAGKKEFDGSRTIRTADWWFGSIDAEIAHLQRIRDHGGALLDEHGIAALQVNTTGSSLAHFAMWPEKLVAPMILAGTSARGVCPTCAAPWKRIVERTAEQQNDKASAAQRTRNAGVTGGGKNGVTLGITDTVRRETVGWEPTCAHGGDPVPATVLDPFSGSGTTGRVALRLGRRYVGCDISAQYNEKLAPERLTVQMGFGL